MPDPVAECSSQFKNFLKEDELIASNFADLMAKFANLRAALGNEAALQNADFGNIALSLESDLDNWVKELPEHWLFKRHTLPAPREGFYTTEYITYPNFLVASCWDFYRAIRSILSDVIMTYNCFGHLAASPAERPGMLKEYKRVKNLIQQLSDETCASVPFFLNRVANPTSPPPGVGGLQSMWALFVCSCMHYIPDAQRAWCIDQLRRIGHQTGIRQALPIADVMQAKFAAIRAKNPALQESEWLESVYPKTWYERLRGQIVSGQIPSPEDAVPERPDSVLASDDARARQEERPPPARVQVA